MKAWRTRILLLAAIVLLPLEVVLLIGLWPFLPWVGKAFAGLLITGCICGAVLFVAFSWTRIQIWVAQARRIDLHSKVIEASGVVAYAQVDGTIRHLSAEQEAAKLQLPAPRVTVREDKEAEAELDKNIIDVWKGGRHSYRAIAEDLRTNYPRVQKVLAEYKKQQGAPS